MTYRQDADEAYAKMTAASEEHSFWYGIWCSSCEKALLSEWGLVLGDFVVHENAKTGNKDTYVVVGAREWSSGPTLLVRRITKKMVPSRWVSELQKWEGKPE